MRQGGRDVASCPGQSAVIAEQHGVGVPGRLTLVERSYAGVGAMVQCRSTSAADGADAPADGDANQVHAWADRGLEGNGTVLPHADRIQRMFGRHDVSTVRAHVGGPAEVACNGMGAEAYASGTRVAFARSPDLHTAAHEAAHVVQQRGGVQLKNGLGISGDDHERHADAVADCVVVGRSAESLLDRYANGPGLASAVQRESSTRVVQRDPRSSATPGGSQVDRLVGYLNAPDPVAGVGDFNGAFGLLNGLSMPNMLATISAAADRGYLQLLLEHSSATAAYDRSRLMAALHAVELARAAPANINRDRLTAAGTELDQIPRDQQLQVFEYILNRRGSSMSVTTLMEGVVAMRESEGGSATGPATATPGTGATGAAPAGAGPVGAPGTVEPGPWNPPGNQPIPFYIGNEAHRGIAAEYQAAHPGDTVRTNTFPLSSILRTLSATGQNANPGALGDAELALMPDIANLTRLHLYEIKPATAQALGATKASMYVGLFARAGVAMTLGPVGEPGTTGGIPAPDGVYMFWAAEPGVIVYQYRKGRLVPVPLPAPENARERRWRFELQPLTPQQQAAMVTMTLGTAMLFIMMIALAPVGI